ncbi:uncharacterized protein LOC108602715 [Drosophila busckii]|uniref:uncharacterized protein LOC108602715 n=1 Tax=Drosophila busckii TaxID=30019 RepID=UPI00083EF75A|nr:uncharacterized protein LOC108602715 [Drosophila busckii]
MNLHKLTFFIVALVASINLTVAEGEAEAEIIPRPTLNPCMLACFDNYDCDRHNVDLVYAIVNNQCVLYQNICWFKKFNCKRINDCLPTVPEATHRACVGACNVPCRAIHTKGVCATFYDGSQKLGRKIFFTSKCAADNYACQNGVAYTEITTGPCP